MDRIKKIVRNKLKEIRVYISETSMTGGSATFTPGTGENYATPKAFNPNKKAKGTQHNYYYKLGFKPVNKKQLRKKSKMFDYRDLWT